MQLELSEEQHLIQKTARDFAERELLPMAKSRDEESIFPEAELRKVAELGMMGVNISEELGGADAGAVAYSLAMEELARGDASVAVAVSVTNMVAETIVQHASAELAAEHVPKLTGGEYLCGAFALSEPEAGSDPAAMRTRATRVDGGWRLSGTKQWITSGDRAGLMVVWAVSNAEAGKHGISAFLVPGQADGLVSAKSESKMGLRGSSTVQLAFDGVFVPESQLLGAEGEGLKVAYSSLNGGRIGIASQAIGLAALSLEQALLYASERVQFGVPIIQHQAIGNMLADCATRLDAARLMTRRAAYLKERGSSYAREASMAKLLATESANWICDQALQIHGGYGYTKDFDVERALRDVRVSRIYEGTSEIQRLVIARFLSKDGI